MLVAFSHLDSSRGEDKLSNAPLMSSEKSEEKGECIPVATIDAEHGTPTLTTPDPPGYTVQSLSTSTLLHSEQEPLLLLQPSCHATATLLPR